MANTFELIASSTVGAGGAASIDFTSIPSTYTDLCLKLSLRSTDSNYREVWINPNGSTTNGTARALSGNGASASSYTATRFEAQGYTNPSGSTASTFTSIDAYIPNYAGSNNKSMSSDGVTENNATTAYAELHAALWSSSSAISSLNIVLATGATIAQYSTAYLYGVKNA